MCSSSKRQKPESQTEICPCNVIILHVPILHLGGLWHDLAFAWFHCLLCTDTKAFFFSQFETPPGENGNMWPANAPQAQKKVGDVWRQRRVFFLSMRRFAASLAAYEKIAEWGRWGPCASSHPALAETLKWTKHQIQLNLLFPGRPIQLTQLWLIFPPYCKSV